MIRLNHAEVTAQILEIACVQECGCELGETLKDAIPDRTKRAEFVVSLVELVMTILMHSAPTPTNPAGTTNPNRN